MKLVSVMKKVISLTLISLMFVFSFSVNASSACLTSIKNEEYESFTSQCMWSPYSSVQTAIERGTVNHQFGQYTSLTEEGELLKEKAEQGNPFYQYYFGMFLIYVFSEDFSGTDLRIHGAELIEAAADKGFIPAMKFKVKSFINLKIVPSRALKLKILHYAKELRRAGEETDAKIIRAIEAKASEEEERLKVKQRIFAYKNLSVDEIKRLAQVCITGFYVLPESFTHISIQKDSNKAIEMLQYLMDEKEDGDAAYRIGKIFSQSEPEKSVEYFKRAAQLGWPKGMRWMGSYYHCKGDLTQAVSWYRKAALQGDGTAERELETLRVNDDYEKRCHNGWPVS